MVKKRLSKTEYMSKLIDMQKFVDFFEEPTTKRGTILNQAGNVVTVKFKRK